jgi:hypothetical protein
MMTVTPAPVKKMPWLAIGLGVLALLCLCAIVIGVAVFAFFTPISVSTSATEAPPVIIVETETALPTPIPAQETEESTNSMFPEAAPAGTAVDIGNNMTLTVLDVTRPADDIVANGSSFNTTAPEGDEFIQVDVEVTCNAEAGATCSFYPTVMKAVLSDGATRDMQTFLEGVEDWDTAIEIESGASEQGFLLFIVPQSESDLVISYQDIYDDQPVYLQLP